MWGGGLLFSVVVLFALGRIAMCLLKEAEERAGENQGIVQDMEHKDLRHHAIWAPSEREFANDAALEARKR